MTDAAQYKLMVARNEAKRVALQNKKIANREDRHKRRLEYRITEGKHVSQEQVKSAQEFAMRKHQEMLRQSASMRTLPSDANVCSYYLRLSIMMD